MSTSCPVGEKLCLGNLRWSSSVLKGQRCSWPPDLPHVMLLQLKPEGRFFVPSSRMSSHFTRDLDLCDSKCFPMVPVWSESLLVQCYVKDKTVK